MWSTSRVRQHFLDYFSGKDHQVVRSSPLVPRNDPSLLFTSAGMVPFKNYFTGAEYPPFPRATSAQKCVRAGGKHNDLENVGYTARHHTFFEMLGNFSFGDYFKEQAIELAWNLISRELGLPIDRLLVTVYVDDDEAATLWRKITGFPDNKIIRISGSDNFWAMGDTGPCGPCSEIFYDHGPEVAGGPPGSPDQDGDRFMEIWNLVFMQYEQLAGKDGQAGERINLPKPSIDTGSGLERLTAVLQGVHSNYEIDLFKSLIDASVDVTGVRAEGKALASHRVIADHLRASCFLIADGISPSNEGRGYVLRRIMRRAMRHAWLLGYQKPLMHQLVSALVSTMGDHYEELGRAQVLMKETLLMEEERFRETLGRGMKLLSEELELLGENAPLPGPVAFRLYDTYGFPLDLTQDILRGEGRSVDVEGFDSAMAKQKADARAHWTGSGEEATDTIWLGLHGKFPGTHFLGYESTEAEGKIQVLVKDGAVCQEAKSGEEVLMLTDQTPFYAESGGQVGDTGVLRSRSGASADVLDTIKKAGDFYVHRIRITSGSLHSGDEISMGVDRERRLSVRAHHTATHLLHAVLRQHLGEQVVQKGSMVSPDRLRFDFSYNGAPTQDQLKAIEREVNSLVRQNMRVSTRLMPAQTALKTGAMALFGEKYGDEVRVITMEQNEGGNIHSSELCGGTHVSRTGDIGIFRIVAETGIAAGIRRIEAVAGQAAEAWLDRKENLVRHITEQLKTTDEQVVTRLNQIIEDKRRLEKEIRDLQMKMASDAVKGGDGQKNIGNITLVSRNLGDVPARELKSIADQIRQQLQDGIVVLGSCAEGKASLVVGVTQSLAGRFSAVDLVRIGSSVLGGAGGGGRPDMAQAGGPDINAISRAFEAIEATLRQEQGASQP